MNRQELEEQLAYWLSLAAGRRFDIEIAGRPLGGKRGELPLVPRDYAVDDHGFTLRFGGGSVATIHDARGGTTTVHVGGTEVLGVTAPAEVRVLGAGDLVIGRGAVVRFGWHYYGRPQTPENWCVDTYTVCGGTLRQEHSGPMLPRLQEAYPLLLPYAGEPLVHLGPLDT